MVTHSTTVAEGQKIPAVSFSRGLCLVHIPGSDATFSNVIPSTFSLFLHTAQKHRTICTYFSTEHPYSEGFLRPGSLVQRLEH